MYATHDVEQRIAQAQQTIQTPQHEHQEKRKRARERESERDQERKRGTDRGGAESEATQRQDSEGRPLCTPQILA